MNIYTVEVNDKVEKVWDEDIEDFAPIVFDSYIKALEYATSQVFGYHLEIPETVSIVENEIDSEDCYHEVNRREIYSKGW